MEEHLQSLREHLGPAALLRWLPACGSTNDELKRIAAEQTDDALRLILLGTEQQDAGRGTRGRVWRQGGAGLDLALSIAFRQSALAAESLARDPRITLLAGVLTARVLRAQGVEAWLKWPNDVLAGDPPGKAGGLLCETSGGWLIVGVGLNVNSTAEAYPDLDARTLSDVLGRELDRVVLTQGLALELAALCGLPAGRPDCSPADLMAEWLRLDRTGGARYTLLREGAVQVTAQGLDPASGALICRGDDGAEYRVQSYTELDAARA